MIDWFSNLKEKQRLTFIQFDVVDFYGSISQELLDQAIEFASNYVKISPLEKATIMQAANSFLCSRNETWVKKGGGTFDITMGGFHGAEVCEIVGLFQLSKLTEVVPKDLIGLSRDDGLAATVARPRQVEILKKKFCKFFQTSI